MFYAAPSLLTSLTLEVGMLNHRVFPLAESIRSVINYIEKEATIEIRNYAFYMSLPSQYMCI